MTLSKIRMSLSLSFCHCVNMNILLKTRVAAALCYSCFPGLGTDGAPPDSEESNVRFIVLHRKSKIKQHYRR